VLEDIYVAAGHNNASGNVAGSASGNQSTYQAQLNQARLPGTRNRLINTIFEAGPPKGPAPTQAQIG